MLLKRVGKQGVLQVVHKNFKSSAKGKKNAQFGCGAYNLVGNSRPWTGILTGIHGVMVYYAIDRFWISLFNW
jgi:hypothetical protein